MKPSVWTARITVVVYDYGHCLMTSLPDYWNMKRADCLYTNNNCQAHQAVQHSACPRHCQQCHSSCSQTETPNPTVYRQKLDSSCSQAETWILCCTRHSHSSSQPPERMGTTCQTPQGQQALRHFCIRSAVNETNANFSSFLNLFWLARPWHNGRIINWLIVAMNWKRKKTHSACGSVALDAGVGCRLSHSPLTLDFSAHQYLSRNSLALNRSNKRVQVLDVDFLIPHSPGTSVPTNTSPETAWHWKGLTNGCRSLV